MARSNKTDKARQFERRLRYAPAQYAIVQSRAAFVLDSSTCRNVKPTDTWRKRHIWRGTLSRSPRKRCRSLSRFQRELRVFSERVREAVELTIGAIVTRALAMFLNKQRRHG